MCPFVSLSFLGIINLCKAGNPGIQSLIGLLCIPNMEVRVSIETAAYQIKKVRDNKDICRFINSLQPLFATLATKTSLMHKAFGTIAFHFTVDVKRHGLSLVSGWSQSIKALTKLYLRGHTLIKSDQQIKCLEILLFFFCFLMWTHLTLDIAQSCPFTHVAQNRRSFMSDVFSPTGVGEG